MTHVQAWLTKGVQQLQTAGIGTARLDTLVLLEDVLGVDRARLLAEPETELSAGQVALLEKLLKRRAKHEPLAYVRGKTEFYGREFLITPAVLEPRPESETMIELLKMLVGTTASGPLHGSDPLHTFKKDRAIRIADVGTGSGALGITAALELLKTQVELLDIDPQALAVAKSNVDKFTLNVSVVQSDLLSQSHQDYDILLCNLPYVPDGHRINAAATHEPRLAIFGGSDGLEVYRQLFRQVKVLAYQPLYILTEALPPQHMALQMVAKQSGYQLLQIDDFIQVFSYP